MPERRHRGFAPGGLRDAAALPGRLCALVAMFALAACASTEAPLVDPRQPPALANVQEATVIAVRPVAPGGTAISITEAREQLFVGMAGAVAGAVSGEKAPATAPRESSVVLVLRLPNGEQRSVVQPAGGERLAAGDAVFVVATGGQLRVLRKQTAPR